MADDRYSWLDKDTAERLLRGEPVDAAVGPDDASARAQAERLAEALAEVLTEAGAGPAVGNGHGLREGELAGEAAATAAFRKAVEERATALRSGSTREESGRQAFGGAPFTADAPRAVDAARRADAARAADAAPPASGAPKPGREPHSSQTPEIVRIARPRWPSRMGRPLRAGLAVAIAGCALGGVAVAAGAGVLPTPFGGESGEPAPAQSVSAAPTGEALSSPPSITDDTRQPSQSPSGTGEGTGTGEGYGRGDSRDGGPNASEGGGSTPEGDIWLVPDGKGGDRQKAAVDVCRKHEAGTLDRRTERRLEKDAGGSKALDRYCDRVLDENRNGDSGRDGGGKGHDGGDGGSGSEKGDKDSGGEDDGDRAEAPAEPRADTQSPGFAPAPAPSSSTSPAPSSSASPESSSAGPSTVQPAV
ncbi:hypothetical protein [Streptomyces sp. 7N604]|uniref:hypothetical protein n=1 Tax=Streptomyces sp. 7N604 TaxID=3457415 RepID=UPI003FD11248